MSQVWGQMVTSQPGTVSDHFGPRRHFTLSPFPLQSLNKVAWTEVRPSVHFLFCF